MRPRAPSFAVVLMLLAVPAPAVAQALRPVESGPAAGTVADGPGREVWVRFGTPVDHAGSRLLILRDGEVVRTLDPRLDAAPEVLYAETGGLAPGRYTLRWEARARPGGPVETGTLDFTVR